MKKLLNSPKVYFIFILPILIGLGFIWSELDLRPLHHDESLNAIYGLYYYMSPESLYYKYDPMLHGPFLYHLLPWFYHLLDESYKTIRLIPAICFSIIPLALIYILKPLLNYKSLLVGALLLTGPSFIYWAKFLRHDQLVFFMFLLMGLSFHPSLKKIRSYLFVIPFMLQFCIKENAYVHLALWAGYIIFDFLILRKDFFIISELKKYKVHLLTSFLIGLFLYLYYYSAGFIYTEGILDGLYRKSLGYWVNQHHIERIKGPFLTQFFTLSWYELPLVTALIYSIAKVHWTEKMMVKLLPLACLLFSLVFHLIYGSNIPETSLWSTIAKLKLGIDFYAFFLLIILSISGTTILLKRGQRVEAFFYYWTTASFFTYSFLGEKVPWLSMYILLPGTILVVLLNKNLDLKFLLSFSIIGISFNCYQAYQLNFINTGSDSEFISQVHTSRDYENFALKLQKKLESGSKINILAYKENTWPLTWYLYKRDGYHFNRSGRDLSSFDLVLDSYPTKTVLKDFQKKIIPLRHWWVPDWNKMGWKEFLSYSIFHKPWNYPGSQKVTIFYKEGLFNF